MLKYKFMSAFLSAVLVLSMQTEASALFFSRQPREADLGVLDEQQFNKKEEDIAFLATELSVGNVKIVKSGSKSENILRIDFHLSNNEFSNIEKGQDIGGWLLDAPKNISASIAYDVEWGSSDLTIELKGVSPRNFDDFIVIGIPGTVLNKKTESVVKSVPDEKAVWEKLSPDYEYTEESTDETDASAKAVEAMEVRESLFSLSGREEISDEEVENLKRQLVSVISTGSSSYNEMVVNTDKFIPSSVLEDIYDNAVSKGASKRALASVCLVLNTDNEEGKTDSRIYVGLKNLVEEENGVDPLVLKNEEDERVAEVAESFKSEAGKEGQVILVLNKKSFGSEAGIVTKLDGRISSLRNKTLYVMNENKKFEKFDGRYEIDAAGFMHLFAENGGAFVLA